ncbi:MAG TPA: PadR family transcriptional regulator [Acidimicrobiales bacterium]|nr:PadR family transcriptional regulator [Acidimicrobiales bacterium]
MAMFSNPFNQFPPLAMAGSPTGAGPCHEHEHEHACDADADAEADGWSRLRARLQVWHASPHGAEHGWGDPIQGPELGRRANRGGRGGGRGGGGGPHGLGPHAARGPRRRHGSRARRGDVRAAILALLAEEPRHGYQLMEELSERTDGMWRPSPGSVYPALSQLEDEGLVRPESVEGKRIFHLTDAGRADAEARQGPAPWEEVLEGSFEAESNVFREYALVAAAVKQFRRVGSPAQHEAALALLRNTRRGLYKILAEDDEPEES